MESKYNHFRCLGCGNKLDKHESCLCLQPHKKKVTQEEFEDFWIRRK